jgi:hypothetical protein
MNTFATLTLAKFDRLKANLENVLKIFTGLNYLKLEMLVDRDKQGEFLGITSNELVGFQYPRMFKSLKVETFGSGWTDDNYWFTINYRYEHFDCGTNGSAIASFLITPDGVLLNCRNMLK